MKVTLAKLNSEQKKKAWSAIKRDQPELATFMQSETFALLKNELGASVIVEVKDGKIMAAKESQ